MCRLPIWVSLAMQDKPWRQKASRVSTETRPLPPPRARVCLGQWVSLTTLGSSSDLQELSLNLSFLTCWMRVIASASTALFEDGETPLRSLWNGFERYQGSCLDRTRLSSGWLTYTNSLRLPDNPVGSVLLLSPFCHCRTEAQGREGLAPSSHRSLGFKCQAVGVQSLCS